MIKKLLLVLTFLLCLVKPGTGAEVCFGPRDVVLANATSNCDLQPEYGAGTNDGHWTLRCTAVTVGFVHGVIPAYLGNQFKFRFTYSTPDTGSSKLCKAVISILSDKGSCAAASTNPGVACDLGSSTCTGGSGACSGAPPIGANSTNFATATNTLTHVATSRYVTPYSSLTTNQRYNINTGASVDCVGSECANTTAKYYLTLYSSGSSASRCDYVEFCLQFP